MGLLGEFMFGVLVVEMVLILLICLPMPSNTVRGYILEGFERVWRIKHVQTGIKVAMGINAIIFFDAMTRINSLSEDMQHDHGRDRMMGSMADKMVLFANQRNAYVTGFSLFLMPVLYRLLHMTEQLHKSRKELKALQAGGSGKPEAVDEPKKSK